MKKAIAVDEIRHMWEGTFYGEKLTYIVFNNGDERTFSKELYEKAHPVWSRCRNVIDLEDLNQ